MAAPAGIRDFLTDYSTDLDYALTESRRCGGALLESAARLIQLDPNRAVKQPVTASEHAPDTELVYLKFDTDRAELAGVAQLIKVRIDAGVSPEEIIILVRSNAPTWYSELEPWFTALDIPLAGGKDPKDLIAEKGFRHLMIMGRLLVNSADSLAWRSLLEITSSVGQIFYTHVLNSSQSGTFADRLLNVVGNGQVPAGVAGASAAFNAVGATRNSLDAINLDEVVIDANGWGVWLMEQFGRDDMSEDAIALLTKLSELTDQEYSLAKFINEIESLAREAFTAQSGVRVMTFNQCKGITVDTAVLVGVESNFLPSARGVYDEEIRLLYVGMTRAKQLTAMTWCGTRRGRTARLGTEQVGGRRESCEFLNGIVSSVNGVDYVTALRQDVVSDTRPLT